MILFLCYNSYLNGFEKATNNENSNFIITVKV